MANNRPDTQIVVAVNTQGLNNNHLTSNGSKVFLLQDGYILANDFLNQFEQLITDILDYYSEYQGWPTVKIFDPEEENDDDNSE